MFQLMRDRASATTLAVIDEILTALSGGLA